MRVLRRRRGPYIVFVVPIAAVSAAALGIGLWRHDNGLVAASAVVWIGIAPTLVIMFRYSIAWDGDKIVMFAFGRPSETVRLCDIRSVTMERASPIEAFQFQRPTNRIAIQGAGPDGQPATVDISLRHFEPASIREFMDHLALKRQDLTIPTLRK